MKMKLIVMVACFCAFAVARADVVLVLDGSGYQAPRAMEYFFEASVFDVDFEGGMGCTGEISSEPGDGLTVRFNEQYYALVGDIVLDFSSDPVQLVMTSDSGSLVCQFDRVFRDLFAIL